MRAPRLVISVLMASALLWSEPSAAMPNAASPDGWHSWHVDTSEGSRIQYYVLIEHGEPARIHSLSWNCDEPTREVVKDHGQVAAGESFAWFRAVVEDGTVDRHVRDAALFGLVESGGESGLEYVDQILRRR